MVPFSVVKNIQMYPLFEGQPSERVVIKYFDRGCDIGDTQAKSGNIELFYVHVRVERCVRAGSVDWYHF